MATLRRIRNSFRSVAAQSSVDIAVLYTRAESIAAQCNLLRTYLADGALAHGTLLISSDATKFKTTTSAIYTLSGVAYAKAATDSLTFTAANTINTAEASGAHSGIWLVQINAAGTISTKAPAANQSYATAAAALSALPAADTGNVALGYIAVTVGTGVKFTCNTDALTTVGSFSNAVVKSLPAAI
jgi:hypothetical protein